MEEKPSKEQEPFEVKMLDQMMELNESIKKLSQDIDALEKRIGNAERTVASTLIIGGYKKLYCKYNTGGVCRQWWWENDPSIPGVQTIRLDIGKYHPQVTDGFCASCVHFEKV